MIDTADDKQAQALAAMHGALEPIERMAASPGPMNTSHLGAVAAALKHYAHVLVYGPPEPADVIEREPDPEPGAGSLVEGSSAPVFVTEAKDPAVAEDADQGASVFAKA